MLTYHTIDTKEDKYVLTVVYEFNTEDEAKEYIRDLEDIEESNKELLDNKKLIDILNAQIETLLKEAKCDIEGVEILI